MVKVVLNACHGGFSVSEDCVLWMRQWDDKDANEAVLLGETYYPYGIINDYHSSGYISTIARDNLLLVEYIETFGSKAASGACAELEVSEVFSMEDYEIRSFDGAEYLWDLWNENCDPNYDGDDCDKCEDCDED